MKAIIADRVSSADRTREFDGVFSQVNRRRDDHISEPEAFNQLLRLTNIHLTTATEMPG